MLGSAALRRPFASASASILQQTGRRAYSPIVARSRPATATVLTRASLNRQLPLRSFRRGYADQQPGTVSPETQQKVKRRGFAVFRWLWRLTYLSTLGGLGYIGYGIYISRNPEDQAEPDPNKKTLVVLGTMMF